MQTKVFNAYRITHENGSIEDINALDLVQALENMETTETESPVTQTFLVKKGIRTLVEDEPEKLFSQLSLQKMVVVLLLHQLQEKSMSETPYSFRQFQPVTTSLFHGNLTELKSVMKKQSISLCQHLPLV